MDTYTYRVKIRNVLFFTSLAMISIVMHVFLLLGFDLSLQSLGKAGEKQVMKIGFVRKVRSRPEKSSKPSAVPEPTAQARPKMKKEQLFRPTLAEAEAKEEGEQIGEMPEAFSQFLDELRDIEQLKDIEQADEFAFKSDSYDILEDSSPVAAPDEYPSGKALDSRVQMVVTRVLRDAGKSPPTFIETRFSLVEYPNLQIEKKDYQKGWLSVYLVISVDSRGEIEDIRRVRPRAPDDLEELFLDVLMEAVNTWAFDRKKSYIHVDVRFYVE